jgi:hypothetical protein
LYHLRCVKYNISVEKYDRTTNAPGDVRLARHNVALRVTLEDGGVREVEEVCKGHFLE